MTPTHVPRLHRTKRFILQTALAACGLQSLILASASADRVVPSWIDIFNPDSTPREQIGRDVTTDPRGNVVICGYLDNGTTTETFFVAKYDGLHGNPIWYYTIPTGETSASRALSVATDSAGNVIATGWYNTPNGHDYYTVKLASLTGNVIWKKPYNNGSANGSDEAARVVVDSDDNVIVTGASVGSGTQEDIYTIKYFPNGNLDWVYRYNSAGNRNDFPEALVLDSDDNVIVAGTADETGAALFYTGKLAKDSATINAVSLWNKTFVSGKYGVTGIAIDPNDNVIVTGLKKDGSSSNTDLYTIKYARLNGDSLWEQSYHTQDPGNIELNTQIGRPYWAGVSVDSEGDVYVATTSSAETPQGETQKRRIYLAKYSGDDGAPVWDEYSVPEKVGSNVGTGDLATGIVTDGAGNTIVIGTSDAPSDDDQLGYYIARYSSAGGDPTAVFRFHGDDDGGSDIPAAVALDKNNGIAITGYSRKPADPTTGGIFPGTATIKLNRFLAVTGDPVTGTGLSAKAKLGTLFTPAVSDTGRVVARVTVQDGKKKLGAIFVSNADGTQQLGAIQNAEVSNIAGAKYKSFFDPVISENGRFAFIANLSGKEGTPKSAVFTSFFSLFGLTIIQPVLQEGKAIGSLTGLVVKSVSSISMRGSTVVALVTITGDGVNKTNNRVLVAIDGLSDPVLLLRTGTPITVDDTESSDIKTISVLSNTKGSTGHGRSVGTSSTAARLGLKDGRTVAVLVNNATRAITQGPAIGQDASALAGSGTTWKSLSLPSLGGTSTAALLGVAEGEDVTKNTDTGIVYTTDGTNFSKLVREGADTAGIPDAKFTAFSDPIVSSNSRVAFLADISGSGVGKKNKTTIWSGPIQAPSLVARQGDAATDTAGEEGTAKWTSFLSLALPGGTTGGPVFTAKVEGKKNNLGLWAQDSGGNVRQLIRTGDVIDLSTGDSVKGFSVLQASPGASGATRSFNDEGGVGLLLKLKKGQAIYYLGIP